MAIAASAASAPAVLSTDRRHIGTFRWLVGLTGLTTALELALENVARSSLPAGWMEDSLVALSLVGLLLALAAATVAWLAHRDAPGLLLLATLVPIACALRLVMPALLSARQLFVVRDWVDGALGLIVLGVLVSLGLAAWPIASRAVATPADEFFQRVVEVTSVVIFAASVSGVALRAAGGPGVNAIEVYHRVMSYAATALVLWLAVEAWRTQSRIVRRTSAVLAAVTLAQAGVGLTSGLLGVSQAVHAIGSLAAWSAAVALAGVSHRSWPTLALPSSRLLSAYVQLTKPKVMSLLLATTACAMVIAARGMPPVGLFIATLIGGALMAGGAGAINHYVDRDIDPLMGRTAWRPIPSGVIAPRDALWFGIVLAILATLVLLAFVNPLATGLSLLGLLGYVFIYTLWLKRSTPSNIVIGGAAGAIPPMVGWAAVTNEIGTLTAWYLFAIIFFWTPPHFWALSLLIRQHYERAGVPMLPVVRGEAETRRQIALYSLQLVALTLLLSPFGLMGLPYFGAAIGLGAIFVGFAVRLWRSGTRAAARGLYLYSMLYLFLLFVAMAVDRVVVGGP
jgi:protoheme IX farnesyltransferase